MFLVCLVGACVVGAVSAHDEEPAPMPTDTIEPETEEEERIEEPLTAIFIEDNPIE